MTWAKVDTGIYRNPKIRLAGRDARDVFVSVLLANAEQFGDGSIPVIYVDEIYLSDTLQCTRDQAREGLKRCVTLHLLHVTEVTVTINGWDSEWRNSTSSNKRVAKHRAKKKAESAQLLPDNPVHSEHCQQLGGPVTLHVTPVTLHVTDGNECNALDKRREEQKREEKIVSGINPDRPAGWDSLSGSKKKTLGKHLESARELWALQDSERSWAGCRSLAATSDRLWKIADRLESGATIEECRNVLAHLGKQARDDIGQRQWFNGSTNWRPENFDRISGQASTGNATRQRAGDFDGDE